MSSDDHGPLVLTPTMLAEDDRVEVAQRLGTKKCSRCLLLAETSEAIIASFHYNRTERRFKSRCRDCIKATRGPSRRTYEDCRKWREANRERYLAIKRRYAAAHAEKARAATAAWREANRERSRENSRRWLEDNREAAGERSRRRYREGDYAAKKRLARRDPAVVERERLNRAAWRATNPDKVRQYDRTKRAKRKGAPGPGITVSDEQTMWMAQDGHCRWCSVELAMTGYHVDHILAIVLGGADAPENGCLACPTCNCRKGDLPIDEWLRRSAAEGTRRVI